MGARGTSKQLSQTSACYCLDNLKCIFFSFALGPFPSTRHVQMESTALAAHLQFWLEEDRLV